jgi:hypothetical protein
MYPPGSRIQMVNNPEELATVMSFEEWKKAWEHEYKHKCKIPFIETCVYFKMDKISYNNYHHWNYPDMVKLISEFCVHNPVPSFTHKICSKCHKIL